MNAPEVLTSCRWKHVRGSGQRALYRATCGSGECRGHLGDLSWRGLPDHELVRLLKYDVSREREQATVAPPQRDTSARDRWWVEHGQEFLALYDLDNNGDGPLAEVLAETIRGLVLAEAQGCGWFMVPRVLTQPDDDKQPIYYGYADTGYRISFSGRRSRRNRQRVGRQPLSPRMPKWAVDVSGGSRVAAGQPVRPPARIWCPMCGTLNHLDWPEQLKDAQPQ